MTAKGMFEKLGYKIKYMKNAVYYADASVEFRFYIRGHLKGKLLISALDLLNNSIPHYTSVDELKAINQQCKELGWLQ